VKIRQQLPPINVGQHDVQHDDIGCGVLNRFKQKLPLCSVDDVIPGSQCATSVEAGHVWVVIDDQYPDLADGRSFYPQEDVRAVYAGFDRHILRYQNVADKIIFGESIIHGGSARDGDLDISIFEAGIDCNLTG